MTYICKFWKNSWGLDQKIYITYIWKYVTCGQRLTSLDKETRDKRQGGEIMSSKYDDLPCVFWLARNAYGKSMLTYEEYEEYLRIWNDEMSEFVRGLVRGVVRGCISV